MKPMVFAGQPDDGPRVLIGRMGRGGRRAVRLLRQREKNPASGQVSSGVELGKGQRRGKRAGWLIGMSLDGRVVGSQSETRVGARDSEWAGLGSSQLMDQAGTEQIRGTVLEIWTKPQRTKKTGWADCRGIEREDGRAADRWG